MCKLLIILSLGFLLSGCGTSKVIQVQHVDQNHQKTYQPIISKKKLRDGCRALANGYLVCPKMVKR